MTWTIARAVVFIAALAGNAVAADDLTVAEEAAVRAAAKHAAPSVVRIETLGGEDADQSRSTAARASGVVVGEDGWIVASTASFEGNPAAVLVVLPDGKRLAAKRVATDHSRQIVLLKIEPPEKLPVPDVAPARETAVGQWAVAVGRTFEGADVNLSVGVVSAVGRVWGKAIQTDAKISPHNVGGPLVDIRGRVLGIITELPLEGAGGAEGDEMYDSGIGFAVPWEHVLAVWQRLAKGEDLRPGKLGIAMANMDLLGEAKIGSCPASTPAHKAGLRAGDRVVAVNGKPVERIAEFRQLTGALYAGDRVGISASRGAGAAAEKIDVEIEVVAELPP